jgi:hypothetical protein
MLHPESEGLVHAQGTIQHQGITTYMYGTHIIFSINMTQVVRFICYAIKAMN